MGYGWVLCRAVFFALVMVLCFFGDEHFDRVPKQNLKFQFEFVYCAPLGKPVYTAVARMSTDDASRLTNSCSRSCLGPVSVFFW